MRALVFMLLLLPMSSFAAFYHVDAWSAGDNLAFVDDQTGLSWLSLTETSGMAYTDAATRYDGWRAAQHGEIAALFQAVFTTYSPNQSSQYLKGCPSDLPCYAEASLWLSLFGSMVDVNGAYTRYAFGLYRNEAGGLSMLGARTNSQIAKPNNVRGDTNNYGPGFTASYDYYEGRPAPYNYGTYLVKAAPPAPPAELQASAPSPQARVDAPAGMLLFGLAGLLVWRRAQTQR
ncbi:hypothetical protein OCL06_03480 [Alteromonas sp. ASW11-19]|uniref:PEP-CTERM sorting domain-containing protein n=1 Tax=Alteromonas salexigens TaxID=2982530 RepID=A0ABT2VN49_9ALTE|nr:hypothetical protein [Alteromonas salexigens]MCU7553661.1 hypothetical protein [Alteromonas salexigens]